MNILEFASWMKFSDVILLNVIAIATVLLFFSNSGPLGVTSMLWQQVVSRTVIFSKEYIFFHPSL